jgi:DNA primase
LSFDGDKAGSRAALRALDLALPQLTPERTIRLILLPAEHDPDSLIRAKGAAGFKAQLDNAIGVTQALFDLLRGHIGAGTPEQRASLRARLEAEAARIAHKPLASEYRRDLLDRFYALQGSKRKGGKPVAVKYARPVLLPSNAHLEQGRILAAILLRHPDLWHDVDEAFHGLELPPWLIRLRDAIFNALQASDRLDSEALITQLHASGLSDALARVLAADPLELPACARVTAMPAEAEQGWWYHYGLLHGRGQLAAEIAQLAAQILDSETEARLIALRRAQLALDADPGIGTDPDD